MRHVTGCAVAVMVAASAATASDQATVQMNNDALRKTIAGKVVHLATPLGGLPIKYRADGTMSAAAGSLASYTGSERDRGRWWVVTDKLCQRWNSWLEGKAYCFRLRQQGGTVHWTRNDGLSGVATILR